MTFTLVASPVLRVLRPSEAQGSRLQNGGFEQVDAADVPVNWHAWEKGFEFVPTGGRDHRAAISCERRDGDGEFGASQTLILNQTNVTPFSIRGRSKAEQVTGSPDNGYSLYLDLIYADGTTSWGRTVSFNCGTHDWELREFVLLPDKPVKTLTLHCLFRGHTGKVWFDEISLAELPTPAGAVLFEGVPVEPARAASLAVPGPKRRYATRDGLALTLRDNQVTSLKLGGRELAKLSPSGFLVRDFAAKSDFFSFSNGGCAELNLRLETRVLAQSNHLVVEGRVADLTGGDRAITLLFALPLDATGWEWGDDMRAQRTIGGLSGYANTINLRSGADGKMSRYPFAAVWNQSEGLALATDMSKPAQYRLVYHAGTKQFFIAYDFGLTAETSRFPGAAEFRFIVYRFAPEWGFRAALQKFYDLFPDQFTKRVAREGTWMPFTDIATVPGFRDFGFAFQEGASNVAFDDRHGIASFVYVEPMSHWLSLPTATSRTYDAARTVLQHDLAGARSAEQKRMAAATLTSGIHTAEGQFSLYLVNAPWCDGGVFTLNPDPDLPATPEQPLTKAMVLRAAVDEAFRKNTPRTNAPGAGLDGVYFDSFEMSAAELNYRREHFRQAESPLVFDPGGRPAQLMIFNTWKFARATADRLHAQGKLTFANAVLWDFSFPAPLLDVLGTEVNWLPRGEYTPDRDALMNFRRALCRQKPYCLLLNTDYERFTPALVEKYFQRCLFYGIWPGFFDEAAAAKNPYWTSPKRYFDRDRELFRKYIPLLRALTVAGWQPITGATASNPKLWLERFGEASPGKSYLTIFNDSNEPQAGEVSLTGAEQGKFAGREPLELVTGEKVASGHRGWRVHLPSQAVAVLEFGP